MSENLFADEAATLSSGVRLLRVSTTGTSQVLKLVREQPRPAARSVAAEYSCYQCFANSNPQRTA